MRYELKVGKNILIVDGSGVHFSNKKDIKDGRMRTLPYDQIASVDYVPAVLAGGCLYFKHINDTSTKAKGIVALQSEDNAFFFSGREVNDAKKIKASVDNIIAERKATAETESVPSSADELLKFKQLLDAGAITQEEYDKKKTQLLGI